MWRLDAWTVFAGILVLLLLVPIAVVLASFAVAKGEVWSHLATTVLPRYLVNTLWLMLGVGAGTAFGGIVTGWLVTMHDFPGRRLFEWALLLPMAMPAYVIGYTYTGLLDFAGSLQSTLRAWFGWGRSDYWFPEIRSLGGAIVMLVLVLYPYVYLLARSAFIDQSVCALEVSRTLGRTRWQSMMTVALPLARPALVAGVALALMEALGDFGTVQYFAVDTFTTGIYRTWLGLGEPAAAAQLAALLLLFVFGVVVMERSSRGQARFHHTSRYYRRLPSRPLTGLPAAIAVIICAQPIVFGFLIPAGALLIWAIEDGFRVLDAPFLRLAANSLGLAALAAAIVVGLAVALAYAMRLRGGPIASLALRIAGLGYAIPGPVIAVGVLLPFAWVDNQVDGLLRSAFGVSSGLLLSGTLVAVLFGYLVRFLALALNTVEASLGRVTPGMDGAARTLGATMTETLARVHVPLIGGGVLTAAILVFVDVLKELPATLIMRPFNFDTLAVRTYQLASDERLAEAALPALAIVAVGILPVIILSRAIARSRPGHA